MSEGARILEGRGKQNYKFPLRPGQGELPKQSFDGNKCKISRVENKTRKKHRSPCAHFHPHTFAHLSQLQFWPQPVRNPSRLLCLHCMMVAQDSSPLLQQCPDQYPCLQAPSSLSDAFFLDNCDLKAGLPAMLLSCFSLDRGFSGCVILLLEVWLPSAGTLTARPSPHWASHSSWTCWAPSLPLPKTTFLAFTTWLPPTYPSELNSNRPPLGEAFSGPFPSPSSWVRCRVLCTALTPWLSSIIILNHTIILLYLPGSLPHWPVSS